MSTENSITAEEFLVAARAFCEKSARIGDGWKLYEDKNEIHKSYIKKNTFLQTEEGIEVLLKAEYVIFYNMSYEVPCFSFNVWNSAGVLLSLESIRHMSLININQKDFYSVITQQEHPIFFRPYFVMHPCHTGTVLSVLKGSSKNIIVTFLGLITPLLRLELPMEYGL